MMQMLAPLNVIVSERRAMKIQIASLRHEEAAPQGELAARTAFIRDLSESGHDAPRTR